MDIERYRQRLLALEGELDQRIGRDVETARDTTDDRPDSLDRSVVDELRHEYLNRAQTDSDALADVRAALQRIADGTFGTCTVCGRPIGEARLDAVPWTPYCVEDQERLERAAPVKTPRA